MDSFLEVVIAGDEGANLEACRAKVFGEAVGDVDEVAVDEGRGVEG